MKIYNTTISDLEELIKQNQNNQVKNIINSTLYPKEYTQYILFTCLKHLNLEAFTEIYQTHPIKFHAVDMHMDNVSGAKSLESFFSKADINDFLQVKSIIPWRHYLSSSYTSNGLADEKYLDYLDFFFSTVKNYPNEFSRFIHCYINSCVELGEINNLKKTFEYLKNIKTIKYSDKNETQTENDFYFNTTHIILSKEQINYYLETNDFSSFINNKHILHQCILNGKTDNLFKYRNLIKLEDVTNWKDHMFQTIGSPEYARKLLIYRDEKQDVEQMVHTIKSILEMQLIDQNNSNKIKAKIL